MNAVFCLICFCKQNVPPFVNKSWDGEVRLDSEVPQLTLLSLATLIQNGVCHWLIDQETLKSVWKGLDENRLQKGKRKGQKYER